ncbi:hypothetical protein EVAR_102965_1 [Eumeta japonica]|uniref:Mos1 transposase HTH domain-containing protein n=1 Tax=Eumeta variegata TaxID=151549 RepID=A0A4C1UQY6_EUMVA|nr:hypothetical protein EVAR_102965_1 [Eumeta japonica]
MLGVSPREKYETKKDNPIKTHFSNASCCHSVGWPPAMGTDSLLVKQPTLTTGGLGSSVVEIKGEWEECYNRLWLAFHVEASSLATVYQRGRTNLTDDLPEGLPSTATTEDNINAVRLMMDTDKRVTYQQIRTSFGIGVNLNCFKTTSYTGHDSRLADQASQVDERLRRSTNGAQTSVPFKESARDGRARRRRVDRRRKCSVDWRTAFAVVL